MKAKGMVDSQLMEEVRREELRDAADVAATLESGTNMLTWHVGPTTTGGSRWLTGGSPPLTDGSGDDVRDG
nr:hypothetical protein [Tanacetum cinerariifolium]